MNHFEVHLIKYLLPFLGFSFVVASTYLDLYLIGDTVFGKCCCISGFWSTQPTGSTSMEFEVVLVFPSDCSGMTPTLLFVQIYTDYVG